MIKTDKKLVFGVGTGRCGSVSLSILLNEQADASVSHELSGHILPWLYDESLLERVLEHILERSNGIVGDVASFYLPYVHRILEWFPDAKFVCLKRDRDLCIASLIAKHGKFNLYQDGVSPGNVWQTASPTFSSELSREEATAAYYDLYHEIAEDIESEHPERLRIFDTECLNTSDGVQSILDFCGFREPDIIVGLRTNQILNGGSSQ